MCIGSWTNQKNGREKRVENQKEETELNVSQSVRTWASNLF